MIILPTHKCFDDALEYLAEAVRDEPNLAEGKDLLLVHGICVAPDGHEFSHAWVEMPGAAIFSGLHKGQLEYFGLPIGIFIQVYRVKETTKYTIQEAWEHNRRSGNFGPWEERYANLCGTSKEVTGAIFAKLA